jgi:hypothetical protein
MKIMPAMFLLLLSVSLFTPALAKTQSSLYIYSKGCGWIKPRLFGLVCDSDADLQVIASSRFVFRLNDMEIQGPVKLICQFKNIVIFKGTIIEGPLACRSILIVSQMELDGWMMAFGLGILYCGRIFPQA